MGSIDKGTSSADIITSSLPMISGVQDLAEDGVSSSILTKNIASAAIEGESTLPQSLLYDPQTGSGLLAVIPHELVQEIITTSMKWGIRPPISAGLGKTALLKSGLLRYGSTYSTNHSMAT